MEFGIMAQKFIDLTGRRIIVTGGARGMGEATVRAYCQAGANVVVMDVLDEDGKAAAAAANAAGPGTACYIRCDITDKESVDTAFTDAIGRLGGLDVLANPAGVLGRMAADEISPGELQRVFAVNVTGTVLTNQAAYRAMKDTGGRIINFASGVALAPYPGGAHYSASKGAVLSWTRSVAVEWAPFDITVNAMVPAIWTPMYDERRAEMTPEQLALHDETNRKHYPLGGRLGDPDRDFAPVMLFLASDGSRFMTGQVVSVSGGATMAR